VKLWVKELNCWKGWKGKGAWREETKILIRSSGLGLKTLFLLERGWKEDKVPGFGY